MYVTTNYVKQIYLTQQAVHYPSKVHQHQQSNTTFDFCI